jgi:hypothetical protein
MTTGRINQVTIFRPRSGHGTPGRAHRATIIGPVACDGRAVNLEGGGDICHVGGSLLRPSEACCMGRQEPPWTIQLPPLSSPSDGPRHDPPAACLVTGRGLTYTAQEEDAFRRVTPYGGYRPGLTPKCLNAMIAIGQLSTDSIGALSSEDDRVFRHLGRASPPG